MAYLDAFANQTTDRSRSHCCRRAGRNDWKGSRIRSWKRAMIRQKQTPPSSYLCTPSPETSPRASITISDWDADDEGTMSTDDLTVTTSSTTRQTSDLYSIPTRPTLADVLANSAPPPWTLSAFTAYLSQNHCLENLEFTMDAERYRQKHDEMLAQMVGMPTGMSGDHGSYLRMLWQRLLDAYIIPDGAREINIPSNIRQRLLSLPNHTTPPEPGVLGAAVKIIFDLMEESVLVSFLNEMPSPRGSQSYGDYGYDSDDYPNSRAGSRERKMRRSRSRKRASPTLDVPYPLHTGSIGRISTISSSGFSKSARTASHFSSGSGDASLTDDSASPSSPNREPMTPPTTPPSSDIGGGSPRSRGDNTWKKMLVWKKKSSNGMRDNRFPTVED